MFNVSHVMLADKYRTIAIEVPARFADESVDS
jgi:hypothetical protein